LQTALNSPVPDIYGCLGTLRYEYPDTSIEHLTKMFDKFYPIMFVNGHIEESDYDEFGVRMDRNSNGKVVSKANLTIASENRQRAKIMSSNKQRILRESDRKRKTENTLRILWKYYSEELIVFNRNSECERLIVQQCMKRHGGEESVFKPKISDTVSDDFGNKETKGVTPSKQMLIAFIKVRSLDGRQVLKNGSVRYASGLSSKKRVDLVNECVRLKDTKMLDPYLERPGREVMVVEEGGGVMMYRYNRMRKEKATFLSSSKEELQCRQDSRQYKR
jgi:hypothetical protein